MTALLSITSNPSFETNRRCFLFRSSSLEALSLIFGICAGVTHALFSDELMLTIPPGILFILSGVVWYCFEVDFYSLKQVVSTFRGFMICWFTITIWICHILRCLFVDHIGDWTLWMITILDLSTFTTAIALMLSVDCVRHVSNYIRLIAPCAVVLNALYLLFEITEYDNLTVFAFQNGEITVNQIELTATIELILFLFTLIFALPLDHKHKYYCIISDKVERAFLFRKKLSGRDITEIGSFCGYTVSFKTHWFCRWMAFLGALSVIHFVIDKCTDYENQIGNLIITTLLVLITTLLMVKHLSTDWQVWKRLLSLFRPYMLVLSICIRLYVPIQEGIWGYAEYSVIDVYCYAVLYDIGMILLLTRDAMLITYPIRFSVALCLMMFAISLFNCVRIQFFEVHQWPSWFFYLVKLAYIQVMMFAALTLKCILQDAEFKKFVLIRSSRRRDLAKLRKAAYSRFAAPPSDQYVLMKDVNPFGITLTPSRSDPEQDVNDEL